ncbi:MAG TPA: hypothetical protein EYG92_01880 [Lutibacter sp.]|nr:hypothetical protein [Lutibacter sp.]
MQIISIKFYLFTVLLFLTFNATSQSNDSDSFNCFSVLIGKEASIDGSVLLAHNEDDGGDRVVNWYKVPNQKHNSAIDSIQLKREHSIAQAKQTYAYLWLEIPELEFSDSYFNEQGLIIASDNCRSREDQAELTNGGIGYWLRRLMVERAKTAREAVELAGNIIETVGYASSGRTYSIADANETWMLSVVNGKHWVAQRVPDNHVAIIPNYYTITQVDLSDTANFLGSRDLITYAIERGWYNPKEGPFNFRKAYSNQKNLSHIGNKARLWVSINALSKKQYGIDDDFPFSFVPKKKIALQDVFKVLRNHYQGTENTFLDANYSGTPHMQKVMSVCSNTNQYGFVAQLRSWLPTPIGSVLWIAPRRPCSQAFIPIYSGILDVPKKLSVTNYKDALANHFTKIDDFEAYSKGHQYLYFDKSAKKVDSNYSKLIENYQKTLFEFENQLLLEQNNFEKNLQEKYHKNPKKAIKKLTKYSNKQLKKAIKNNK